MKSVWLWSHVTVGEGALDVDVVDVEVVTDEVKVGGGVVLLALFCRRQTHHQNAGPRVRHG